MKAVELKELTDKILKKVPRYKKRYANTKDDILKNKLQRKLLKIQDAVGSLSTKDQMFICYRYFDKLTYKQIALKTDYNILHIQSSIDKSLIDIGRKLFGYEIELFNSIYYYDEELLDYCNSLDDELLTINDI